MPLLHKIITFIEIQPNISLMSAFVSEIMQRLTGQDLLYLKNEWGIRQLNVISFTDSVLHLLSLTPQEKLNFTKGIVQLFRKISVLKQSNKINFSDCHDYFVSKNSNVQAGIYQKQLPQYVKEETRRYAEPPVVYGKKDTQNVRIREYLQCKDAQGNAKKPIKNIQVTSNNKYIFCLYERSDDLFIYDSHYNRKKILKPDIDKELISSFKWSQKQGTVGVIQDRSITFWSEKDEFKFPLRFVCDDFMMHLDYLESSNLWITIRRKDGAIVYWDIATPKYLQIFEHQLLRQDIIRHHNAIQYLQIKFASLFCVAAGTRMHFVSFNKKQLTLTIDIFKTKIRSIDFSDEYQLMFVVCFDIKVNVFELNPVYCDFLKKQSKIESKNIIVSVTHRPRTSILVTFDEGNLIKLWNIVDMVCYQTVQTGSSVPITCMICLSDRLLVGGLRISFYLFTLSIVEEKKVIHSMTAFDQNLFLAVNKQIRCVNLKTGKTDSVLESITEEQVSKIYFNERRQSLAVLTQSGLMREVSLHGQQVQKDQLPKDLVCVILDKQSNTCFVSANKQVMAFTAEHGQQFKASLTICKIKCSRIAYNYFLDMIALLEESTIFVLDKISMAMTHQIEIATDDLLDFQFVSGTDCIMLVYRTEVIIFTLSSYGTIGKKYKVPLELQGQTINCFKLIDDIDDKNSLVKSLDLYMGTNKGKLHKGHIRNVNFPIPRTKVQLEESSIRHEKKNAVISLEMMKFNFMHDKAFIANLDYSYLISQITTRQTKLKNIKFLEFKPDTTVPSLVIISNVNMVLVYNCKCELIGQINISFTYPIQWQAEDYTSINQKHQQFAKKILNFLGEAEIQDSSPKKKLKEFVIRDQVEDLKTTQSNTFKKRIPFGQVSKRIYLQQVEKLQSQRKRLGQSGNLTTRRTKNLSQTVITDKRILITEPSNYERYIPSRLATQPVESIYYQSPIRHRTLDRSRISSQHLTKGHILESNKKVIRSKSKRPEMLVQLKYPKEVSLPALSRKVSSSADKLRRH